VFVAAVVCVAARPPASRVAAPGGAAGAHPHPAGSAAAHAHLVSSSPAAGDTVAVPGALRLAFSEPIEEAFAGIVLRAWTGREAALAPRRSADDERVLEASLPDLAPGGYRVDWRIVSADGHPIAGSFEFYVAAPAPGGPAAGAPRLPTAPPPLEAHASHGDPAGTTGEPPVVAAVVRGLSLGSLMALAGLLAVTAWLSRGPFGRLDRVAVGLAVAAPLLAAGDFLLWLQHAAPDRRLTAEALTGALATRSGLYGALRVGLAALALWAIGLARRRSLAAVLAMGALVLSAPTGHPAAIRPELAVPAKALHLVAIAVWSGGLLLLLLSGRRDEPFRADAARVSTAALLAVVTIAATGVLQVALFLARPLDLVRSTYGLLSLGKIAGLLVLVGFGVLNRYRLLPRLRAGAGPEGLRRSVRAETLVMAAVVLLAAFLAYVPPPAPLDESRRAHGASPAGGSRSEASSAVHEAPRTERPR
jgi:copper transport protein